MEASKYSLIKDNEIYNNKEIGVYLHGRCDETEIFSNLIKNNSNGIIIKETNNCIIQKNNFVDNTKQASFIRSRGNKWNSNSWSDAKEILPYLIKGTINFKNLPWINFDWRPLVVLI